MGIVFLWRLRVYAFWHELAHWMDLLDFDRRSGVAPARVTNCLPANSRRRLHFPKSPHLSSQRPRHNRALPMIPLSCSPKRNAIRRVYNEPARTSSESSESCLTFRELREASYSLWHLPLAQTFSPSSHSCASRCLSC